MCMTNHREDRRRTMNRTLSQKHESPIRDLQCPVKNLCDLLLACPAALCTPEERFPAGRAVIALQLRSGPFNTALLITEFGYLGTP